jgi:protein tyrosine phosphatase (PTP) superfamily phosphohydrolase (DUF442 family)
MFVVLPDSSGIGVGLCRLSAGRLGTGIAMQPEVLYFPGWIYAEGNQFMTINFAVAKCTLPVAHDVCFKLTGPKIFYVTSQPVYLWPGASPYQAIAQAGIRSVLSVRDPAEFISPLVPFDLTETDQLVLNSVACSNIPLPHIAMTQAQFNAQGFNIATALNGWLQPGLMHCSSGDRASAAFGCYLINFCGFTNAQALAFAQGLALKNQQFIDYLGAYPMPPR